jgi:amidase
VDSSIREAILNAAKALKRAGAKVDHEARPAFNTQVAHGTYSALLAGTVGARRPDYATLLEARGKFGPTDQSPEAVQTRAMTASFKDIFEANNRREELRWAWRKFFDKYDVVLTPVTTSTAFPHDHSEPVTGRVMMANGGSVPYFSQLYWAGLASCAYLPATAAPIGFDKNGLPMGMQIIGPEMGDRTTIWTAAQLAKLIGGFVAPKIG